MTEKSPRMGEPYEVYRRQTNATVRITSTVRAGHVARTSVASSLKGRGAASLVTSGPGLP